MKFLFLEEVIRLLYRYWRLKPQGFISIFDTSECLVAFTYDCNEKSFTRVSKSFVTLLGYNLNNIVDSRRFVASLVHPHDRRSLNHFLDTIPKTTASMTGSSDGASRIKCRVRHMKGYWKYFILFTRSFFNSESNSWQKIGLIADQYQSPAKFELFLTTGLSFDNGSTLTNQIAPDGTERDIDFKISPRESEILELISDGLIAKQIAEKLNISTSTVITHRKNLISKFHANNTAELVKKATQLMLI